jgi:flagellar hook-associated protein 3 FlgL
MPNTDMQYYLRRQEEGLANIQSKIAGQNRLYELRDDPLAASHAVRYESYLARLNRFEQNNLYAQDHFNHIDGYLQQANSVLHRIREISVQGATGTYAREDLRNMAVEINELLKELVSVSNALGPDGKYLFAGDKAFTEPFRIVEGSVAGGDSNFDQVPLILRVDYLGAGSSRRAEVSDGTYSVLDLGGGEAFWAEKMQIFSSMDASAYRAEAAGAFFVDGVEITVNPGDTLPAIVAKINDSPAPVKAYIDPESRGLVLEGTSAHLIKLEDRRSAGENQIPQNNAESHVLQDLGILGANTESGAPNWNSSARVSGGSAFDMVIRLRDGLLRGDYDFVGSQGILGIDLAMTNLQSRLTEIGSREERVEMTWSRINEEIPNVSKALSREAGLNLSEAATDLSMMEFAHRAALQTAAKVIPPTLLDFLR